jgi:hypothetical protein
MQTAVDLTDEEIEVVAIESEATWFNLAIGSLMLTVTLEQLEALDRAVSPFFREPDDDR